MPSADSIFQDLLASQAERDGNSQVATMFRAAATRDRDGAGAAFAPFDLSVDKMGETQATLFCDTLGEGEAPEELDYHLCSICGYAVENRPLVPCPVCTAHPGSFYRVA